MSGDASRRHCTKHAFPAAIPNRADVFGFWIPRDQGFEHNLFERWLPLRVVPFDRSLSKQVSSEFAMAEAGRALHLIYVNEEGKFELGEEAIQALCAVRGPVAVCAVCGRARQGKSFILNKLAASAAGEGFVVGPTHRPCTKGIWIWSAPLVRLSAAHRLMSNSRSEWPQMAPSTTCS